MDYTADVERNTTNKRNDEGVALHKKSCVGTETSVWLGHAIAWRNTSKVRAIVE